jgi:cellulose biosynthesis protein BcsQ
LRRVLRRVQKDYDLVFLDCPPSISLVSESVFEAADALIVPLVPTPLSVRTFEQLEIFLADSDWRRPPRVIGFFSMVDGRKALHQELVAKVIANHPEVVAPTIPSAIDVERMGVHRAPVTATAPKSRSAKAYRALWSVISERIA